jgi:hypothetical protein
MGLGVRSAVTPIDLLATPMTWVNYKGYMQAILETDWDPDSYGVLISPSMHAYLDSTPVTLSGPTVCQFSLLERIRDGHPNAVQVGNEINASSTGGKNAMFLGLWRFLTIMLWSPGVELIFDEFSSMDSYITNVRCNALYNIGIVIPSAFAAIRQN